MLAKSKLNSIETLSQEEFVTILKEKDKCETMKDNLKTENEKYKIMSLTCEIKDLSEKLLSILCHQKIIIFFLCKYKCTHVALIHWEKLM